MRNSSQDPDYEGLPYHEKKFHKTHFSAAWDRLKRRRNGDEKEFNGALYTWLDGAWKPKKEVKHAAEKRQER